MQHVTITPLLPAMAPSVCPASVDCNATKFADGRWQHGYTIINDLSASFSIKTVLINLDDQGYFNLECIGGPETWDLKILSRDLNILSTFDATIEVAGIVSGESQDGFMVAFDWLAARTPGKQFFKIVNQHRFFEVISSGWTIH